MLRHRKRAATHADPRKKPVATHFANQLNELGNYYPFSLQMKGRTWSDPAANQARYGFNGKEDDRETSTQDYGFRIYYPRIGKFLSIDPLTKQYSELTPYQFASNRPIGGIDLDGLEWLDPALMFSRPMPMLEPASQLAVGRAAPMEWFHARASAWHLILGLNSVVYSSIGAYQGHLIGNTQLIL